MFGFVFVLVLGLVLEFEFDVELGFVFGFVLDVKEEKIDARRTRRQRRGDKKFSETRHQETRKSFQILDITQAGEK